MATTKILKMSKLTATVGAEVLDVDVERIREDDDLPAAVMVALEAHGILVFRGLHLDDATQAAFWKTLGDLVLFPGEPDPELLVISLDPDHPYAAYLAANEHWHMDDTRNAAPSKATILSAKVISAEGGETEFASTYAAYDDLSEDEQERCATLRIVHSPVRMQQETYGERTDEQMAFLRSQEREHPLVWTHADGRRSLVIGRTADHVVGMDLDEGRALLDGLLERATRPDRVYRHVWSEGDTVMWDNPGVLHRRLPYDPASHRRMHRCTIAGEPIR